MHFIMCSSIAVRRNVLQCVAVCCSVLQYVAVIDDMHLIMCSCIAVRRNVLQCIAVCCSVLLYVAVIDTVQLIMCSCLYLYMCCKHMFVCRSRIHHIYC